jgi:hypothetical protein
VVSTGSNTGRCCAAAWRQPASIRPTNSVAIAETPVMAP